MSDLPKVCICIPTYNSELTIRETLSSILGQTYNNIVVKVIDNCSTDKTIEIVSSYSDSRIKIYRNTLHLTGNKNMNRCLSYATGCFTAIFHSDDVYDPEIVQKQVTYLEKFPHAGIVFTEARKIDMKGRPLGFIPFPSLLKEEYAFMELFKLVLKYSNFMICPSAMVRTKIYREHKLSFESDKFGLSSDLGLWLNIAMKYHVGFIKQKLISYRISKLQNSQFNRESVKRADFFLVIGHYLSLRNVKNNLHYSDFDNLNQLILRDDLMIAINLILGSNYPSASKIISDIISINNIKILIKSKKGLQTLCISLFILILIRFHAYHLLNYLFKLATRIH